MHARSRQGLSDQNRMRIRIWVDLRLDLVLLIMKQGVVGGTWEKIVINMMMHMALIVMMRILCDKHICLQRALQVLVQELRSFANISTATANSTSNLSANSWLDVFEASSCAHPMIAIRYFALHWQKGAQIHTNEQKCMDTQAQTHASTHLHTHIHTQKVAKLSENKFWLSQKL